MTGTKDKLRGLFLASLMVLSVVAATTAFAGSAAAFDAANVGIQSVDLDQSTTNDQAEYSIDVEIQEDDATGADRIEVDLDSGDTFPTQPDVTGLSMSDVSVSGATVGSIDTNFGDNSELAITLDNAVDYSEGDVVTVTLDGVTNPDTPTDDYDQIGTTAASQPTVAVTFDDEDGNTASDQLAEAYSIEPSLQFTDLEVPDSMPNSDTTVSATIENVGTQDMSNVDVALKESASTPDVVNDGGTEVVASKTVSSIDAGSSTQVEFTVDSSDYSTGSSGDKVYHGIVVTNNPVETSVEAPVVLGGDDELGSITANVQDGGGNALDNATIQLYYAGDWTGSPSGSGAPLREFNPAGDGVSTVTFDNLAQGSSGTPGTYVDYVLYANKDEFASDSTQESLHAPNNEGPTRVLTLRSNLEPSMFGIGAWDPETETVTGNTSSLFANGEFDNQAQLVVFTQTQSDSEANQPLIEDDVTVTIAAANRSTAPDVGPEDRPLEFVTNQTNENTSQMIDVTITPDSPVANVDGNSSTGVFSYETVNVTARNATNDNVDPLRIEDYFAWTDDITNNSVDLASELQNVNSNGEAVSAGEQPNSKHIPPAAQAAAQPLQGPIGNFDDNYGSNESSPEFDERYTVGASDAYPGSMEALLGDVFYFVEGDRATQHQVFDVDGEPIEDATVWVAYDSGPQDLSTIESFQNAAGESFLVGETNENGLTVIPGLVQGAPYNVYVVEDGFNIFNSSTTDVSEYGTGTLAGTTNLPADYFVADYELNNTIVDDEGGGEDDVYSHVLRQQPQAYNLSVTVANETGTFVKSTRMPDDASREVRIEVTSGQVGQDPSTFTPAEDQVLDLELLNDTGIASLADTTVETDENGIATTTINSDLRQTGVVNISASTENAEGTEYRTDEQTDDINEIGDQAEVIIFTAANIEGDVVDAEDEDVPGAEVELFRLNQSSGAYETTGRTTVTTGTGSFTFTDVPTGEDYRVTATFENDEGQTFTGFNQNQLEDLGPGTTTAGITLSDLVVEDNCEDLSDVSENYDSNDDCSISISELNAAAQAYLDGDISISELNVVAQDYLNS